MNHRSRKQRVISGVIILLLIVTMVVTLVVPFLLS